MLVCLLFSIIFYLLWRVIDIDECGDPFDLCDTRVNCTNLPGNYSCGPCPNGFTGNGYEGCIGTYIYLYSYITFMKLNKYYSQILMNATISCVIAFLFALIYLEIIRVVRVLLVIMVQDILQIMEAVLVSIILQVHNFF